MKKIIYIILSILITFFTLIITLFFIYKLINNPKIFNHVLKISNYYDISYPVIVDNLKNQIGNVDLKVVIDDVISKKRVVNDIESLLNSNEEEIIKNSIKDDLENSFKKNLENTDYDNKSLNELIENISNSYIKNLFPYNEFNKLYSNIPKINNINLKITISILLLIILYVVAIILSNEKRIIIYGNYISSFILLFPYFFFKLGNLFNDFYYTNTYFSIFIKNYIYYIINLIALLGLIILFINIIFQFIINKKQDVL